MNAKMLIPAVAALALSGAAMAQTGPADTAPAPSEAALPGTGTSADLPWMRGAELSWQDKVDIDRVEAFLNGLETVRAAFVQINPNGEVLSGDFYLKRPGRLRFEYRSPVEDLIVADRVFIHFWDSELEEHSNVPIGETLADLFVRERLDLESDVQVMSVYREPDLLALTAVDLDEPDAGQITLFFEPEPLRLTRWRVVDGSGNVTEVSLYGTMYDVPVDASLFVFEPPTGAPN